MCSNQPAPTPVSGVMIAKALDGAGIPKGVFNLVPGSGEEVGNKLIEDERIRMVAFTGSTAVGRGIAAKASALFKKYSLEMGGKNPLILLKDFDVEQAVRIAGIRSIFPSGTDMHVYFQADCGGAGIRPVL